MYECTEKKTLRKCALKVVDLRPLRLSGRSARTESFRRETDILSRMEHPNIVRLYEVFETDDALFLVEELATGGELLSVVLAGAVPEAQARAVMIQVFSALAYLHSLGILHRDVKAENVLVQPRSPPSGDGDDLGVMKLVDFGLSKQPGAAGHSVAHSVVGTPQYFAPELLWARAEPSRAYGPATDCWSVGVLLYLLLSRQYPFEQVGADGLPRESRILSGIFEFGEPWRGVSDAAKDLVAGLLTVDPSRRYTMAQALCHPWLAAAPAGALSCAPVLGSSAPVSVAPDQTFLRGLPESGLRLWLNADDHVVSVDEVWPRKTGLHRSDILGKPFEELIAGDSKEKVAQLLQASRLTGSVKDAAVLLRCNAQTNGADRDREAGGAGADASGAEEHASDAAEVTLPVSLSGVVLRDPARGAAYAGMAIACQAMGQRTVSWASASTMVSVKRRHSRDSVESAASNGKDHAERHRRPKRRRRDDAVRTMVHSIDANGYLVSVCNDWVRTMRYSRSEVLGRRSTEFLTAESREVAVTHALPTFMATGRVNNVEYRWVRKDGTMFDSVLDATGEVDTEGNVLRSIAIITIGDEVPGVGESLATAAAKETAANEAAAKAAAAKDAAADAAGVASAGGSATASTAAGNGSAPDAAKGAAAAGAGGGSSGGV